VKAAQQDPNPKRNQHKYQISEEKKKKRNISSPLKRLSKTMAFLTLLAGALSAAGRSGDTTLAVNCGAALPTAASLVTIL
jgi:hypothetical protein